MNIHRLIFFVLSLFIAWAMFSCDEDRGDDSLTNVLILPADTIMFDTVFTTIGSVTHSFKVKNGNNNQSLFIPSIKIAGGKESKYHLNVNGEANNEVYNIVIPPRDSIYIFIELNVNPIGANQPLLIKDSIIFTLTNSKHNIKLVAWGQDVEPIRKTMIKTSTWNNKKPYVVYEYAYIDSNETLTIEPGAKIYFNKNAGLYIRGAIVANGTTENPIKMAGMLHDQSSETMLDQWKGITILSNNKINSLRNISITNANIGLQIGTVEQKEMATIKLHNVKIQNMAYAGIFAVKANINASNLVISNCRYYCAALLVGGKYNFSHATIANYWEGYAFSKRNTPSVFISNMLQYKDDSGKMRTFISDMIENNWTNSIIWGSQLNEVNFMKNNNAQFNYQFNHCLIRTDDTLSVNNSANFINTIRNKDPHFENPLFNDFRLDSLSVAKDFGETKTAKEYSTDILNEERTKDKAPDLGAYERIKKPKVKL